MKLSRILIILVIGCVAGLLLVYGVKLQAQNRPNRDAIMAKMGEMNIDMSQIKQFRNRQQGSNLGSQKSSNREQSKKIQIIIGQLLTITSSVHSVGDRRIKNPSMNSLVPFLMTRKVQS